jgi:hypothetical protein
MVWLFAREGETLKVETQYDNVTREYILTLRQPDGNFSVERYPTAAVLEARLARLEDVLQSEAWQAGAKEARMVETWHL